MIAPMRRTPTPRTKDAAPGGRRRDSGRGRAAATAAVPLLLLLLLPALPLLPGAAGATDPGPRARPLLAAADARTPPEAAADLPEADPGATPHPAPDPAAAAAAADLFALPRVTADIRRALGAAAAGDPASAASLLDRDLANHPGIAGLHAARAGVAMLEDPPAGGPGLALDHLVDAAAAGFPDLAAVAADPVFAPLAADPVLGPRLAALVAAPPGATPGATATPAPIVAGVATVSAANTAWNPAAERLEARFAPPEGKPGPVLPARPKAAALDILREHWKRGRAAGNAGDLYDNRDRGHSALKTDAFPQLARIVYAPEARAAELDYGLQDKVLFDRPTFGNSSTAVTGGVLWRSLPRLAMTQGDGTGPLRLWQNTQANALYVYPAHKDWTPDRGDLFPANTPYILVSHGSSGSDEPFLQALALTYAAFRPDTKARLVKEHLLVPTVQMIFRRSLRDVTSRESYFSGDANPAVFEGGAINPARMVSLAQSIKADAIPPEVRIAVTGEEFGIEGIDYFGEGLSEQLFDTPGAIARIWRSKAWERTMTVSAAETRDPNGRPLTFHWRLLQGDPEKVRITPSEDGTRATITLDWHDPFPISDDNPIVTSRVDVGVFASNGAHDLAPAILSWYFPPTEKRRYEAGPDGTMRIATIDHANPDRAYADPILVPRADWRDDSTYDEGGSLAGWTRVRRAGPMPPWTPSTRAAGAFSAGPRPWPTHRTTRPPPPRPGPSPTAVPRRGRPARRQEVDAAPF